MSTACMVGLESVFAFGERSARHALRWTIVGTILFLGPFYYLAAWAVAVAAGSDAVVAAAQGDPTLPITILAKSVGVFGPIMSGTATALLITSVFAATCRSMHPAPLPVCLGRERVLPASSPHRRLGSRAGTPPSADRCCSRPPSGLVVGFAMAGADPVSTVFTWLAALAAVAVLILLVTAGWARAVLQGRRRRTRGSGSPDRPLLGVISGCVIARRHRRQPRTLLGVEPGSVLTVIIPGLVVTTAAWAAVGAVLRLTSQETFRDRPGRPHPLALPDQRLVEVVL